MNKYQEALDRLKNITNVPSMNEIVEELFIVDTFRKLIEKQEFMIETIEKHKAQLKFLNEYTMGHSLLNSLICELEEIIYFNEVETNE